MEKLEPFKEKLRATEERYRSVIESAYDAFIAIDEEGNITEWNRQAEKTFGWKRAEVLGKALADIIIPPSFRKQHWRGMSHFLATEEGPVLNQRLEVKALHRDGHEFPVELTIWPVRIGERWTFNAFLHDVTEIKRSEEALRQKSLELARSKIELEQLELFAFAATHDIQEPLHKIISFGDLLKDHSKSRLDRKGLAYLDRIQRAAEKMRSMLDELRELARIDKGGKSFSRVSLQSAVEEVLADLDFRIKETGAKVTVGPLPELLADGFQIQQLFQNLLSNAVKFRRPGVRPEIVIRSRKPEPGWIEITVEDNGIGFDEKYADKIFRPFQRLHGSGEFAGSGLGLAICQKIVLRHGGKITARSIPDTGSTFVITLPQKPEVFSDHA
jgi:two-component system sensor kinase FixL